MTLTGSRAILAAPARADVTLREAITYCAVLFAVLRIATLVLGFVAVSVVPPLDPVGVPGWPAGGPTSAGWHTVFTAWERFDALWFMRIADTGYRLGDGSPAFFPAYPLAIRAVSFVLGGHPFAAALLVSNAAFLGALVVVYLLTAEEFGRSLARTSVVLLATFPTSYFFLMPYSESMFLLFAVSAFRWSRRGRWPWAAAAGAAATLTRSIGVVLVPALAIEAIHRARERGERPWPGLLAAGGAASGTLLYLGWWQIHAGDWLAPLTRQQNWQRELSWPFATLWEGTRTAFAYLGRADGWYWLIDWLIVVPVIGLAVVVARRLRPSYAIYVWGSLLIPLTLVFRDRPLMSMPRFVLPLFPVFWAAALLVERSSIPRWALGAAGATGLAALAVLTVNWYYVF